MYILDIFRDYKKNLLFQFSLIYKNCMLNVLLSKNIIVLNVTIIIVDYKILKRYMYI